MFPPFSSTFPANKPKGARLGNIDEPMDNHMKKKKCFF